MFKEKIDLFSLYVNASEFVKPLSPRHAFRMLRSLAVSFVKETARYVPAWWRQRKRKRPDFRNRKIVYANTVNNYQAVKFLLEKYPGASLVCVGSFVSTLPGSMNIRKFLIYPSHLSKYLFVLYVWLHPRYRARNFNMILRSYGHIDKFVHLFRENRPACIFISNDHFPDSRALILAARKLKIKCIYIQHASVTSLFPAMRASHALLYGQYSEDIYIKIGDAQGQMLQVGNHKFDGFKESIVNKQPTGRIGVAFNKLDPVQDVLDLCEALATVFSYDKVILRPHPADKRSFDSRFRVSKAEAETSIDFLKSIDVIVAGNSNILLEAASMNVYALQTEFGKVSSSFVDYYGFIRTGVAKEVKTREQLVREISTIFEMKTFDNRKNTKPYDASVGRPYEFDVENYIVSVIDKILAHE